MPRQYLTIPSTSVGFASHQENSSLRCSCCILICMQKHIQHNKDERTQFFRKIYLSLYSKGLRKVMCEKWVGDWIKTATYWPSALLALAAFLSRSPGLLNLPLLGPGSHSSNWNTDFTLWSPTDWLPVAPGSYYCLTSTCFLWSHNSHSIQPVDSQGYPPISSPGCTCISDSLPGSEVNMLHSLFE